MSPLIKSKSPFTKSFCRLTVLGLLLVGSVHPNLFGQVHLLLRTPDGKPLAEGTHVLVLFEEGDTVVSLKEKLPLPGDYPNQHRDRIGAKGLSLKLYPFTQVARKVLFVYALTPDSRLYFSSDYKGTPQFKRLVKGLIWVEELQKDNPIAREISLLLEMKVSFLFHSLNGEPIPEDSWLLVNKQSRNKSFRLSLQDLPNPHLKTWTIDQTNSLQQSRQRYHQTEAYSEVYFVYLISPQEKVYYSSSADGTPIYDQVATGKLYLNELAKSVPQHHQVLAFAALHRPPKETSTGEERAEKEASAVSRPPGEERAEKEVTQEPVEIVPPTEVLDENIPVEHEITKARHNQPFYRQKSFLIISGIILIFGITGFFLRYWGTGMSYYYVTKLFKYNLAGGGGAFLSTLVVTLPVFESYRLPAIFAFTGLLLGFLHLYEKREASPLTLYTFIAAGFTFSFFPYEVFEGKIFEGSMLMEHSLDFFMKLIIAIAAAVFVYIFALMYQALGSRSQVVVVMKIISLPVFLLVFFDNPFFMMPIIITFLFLVVAIFWFTFTLLRQSFQKFKDLFFQLTIFLLGITALILNFIIGASLLAFFIFWQSYQLMSGGSRDSLFSDNKSRQSLILAIGSLIFHLAFFIIFRLYGLDPDLLGSQGWSYIVLQSLIFTTFGMLAGSFVAISIHSTKKSFA